MEDLRQELLGEIEGFREKGYAFLNGEMAKMDFKHASGGFGVYAHRDGKEFMIRLRIPSGVITMPQLQLMYDWAVKYKMEKLHLTTRQAVQYHGLTMDEICSLMKEALDEYIYTRGAGGNFPRNVALSPLAGVDSEEPFDPTPYALETGSYFMERITSYKLPRKLKVSFSNSERDTAHCTIQDLGFLAVDDNGKNKFRVYLGGGLGRNPRLALIYPELIEPNDVLYYVEAMVNLFKAEGNYENKARARVRYMVEKLGEEGFINEYKKYVDEAKSRGGLDLNIGKPYEYEKKGIEVDVKNDRVFAQKQKGLYSYYIHPVGGQLLVSDMKKLIDVLDKFEDPEIRLSMTEGFYIRDLNGEELKELIKVAQHIGGNTSFEYSVSCIGVPTCQMGLCVSQDALNDMLSYVKGKAKRLDLLPRIYFSGCGNSCAVHQIGEIGFTGKKKKVDGEMQDAYEMQVDGSFEVGKARLGETYGDILKKDIPEFIYQLSEELNKQDKPFEKYVKENTEDFRDLFEKFKC